jgi:hypothetical protein
VVSWGHDDGGGRVAFVLSLMRFVPVALCLLEADGWVRPAMTGGGDRDGGGGRDGRGGYDGGVAVTVGAAVTEQPE